MVRMKPMTVALEAMLGRIEESRVARSKARVVNVEARVVGSTPESTRRQWCCVQ